MGFRNFVPKRSSNSPELNMASNKVNSKCKIKINKATEQSSDNNAEIDFAMLRKPIANNVTGFAQARNIFDLATSELKSLIAEECDLLYECKVCRNLFRSLINFLSHKRIYCKENFNSNMHGHFAKAPSLTTELLKIKRLEDGYQESLRQADNTNTDDFDKRVPLTKDLTTILEVLNKQRGVPNDSNDNVQQISLHKIPTSKNAVFQSIRDDNTTDNMAEQVKELDCILSQDKAVLQDDGKCAVDDSSKPMKSKPERDGVIQISDDDEESNSLKCKICKLQFSTQKTLKFHMKCKHLESRLVYPCPDCVDIFSTSWSVYRHLFKVHRKSAAQIRRLRESIQAKAFRMNNPPAFYEKRKNNMKSVVQKVTEEERIELENQAWMYNLEGDSELPRCGGCGRTFERRAALAAHTHTCQPRNRALARRHVENKKIEIQIRKDYNKGSTTANGPMSTKPADKMDKHSPGSDSQQDDNSQCSLDNSIDLVDNTAKELLPDDNDSDMFDINNDEVKMQLSGDTEQRNFDAFKKKIEQDVDWDTLQCKKCNTICLDADILYKHMAGHYKWYRYGCKLCNFKHYQTSKLLEHVKDVHKLKGDVEFYFTTVKALDATEAIDGNGFNDSESTSPDSRRPSRCSSDSSRHSDNESSSGVSRFDFIQNRKRKLKQLQTTSKKKKEVTPSKDENKIEEVVMEKLYFGDEDTSTKGIGSEENSSDLDFMEDKLTKKHRDEDMSNKVTSTRRPVRKRCKPKNDDFEYDLSNLLKLEAQGYRDSQQITSTTIRTTQNRKKTQIDMPVNVLWKDSNGAVETLSKLAVDKARAHMRIINSFSLSCPRPASVFVKPLIPKVFSKTGTEKVSPLKEPKEEPKETIAKSQEENNEQLNSRNQCTEKLKDPLMETTEGHSSEQSIESHSANENPKINVPLVPLKFRRHSLEVMKNPVINKNISEFSKAGMKTKILVIKPIHRDGTKSVNAPLKFQTIKLKNPNKSFTITKEKMCDQRIKVVKMQSMEAVSKSDSTDLIDKVDTPNESSKVVNTTEVKTSAPDTVEHSNTDCD